MKKWSLIFFLLFFCIGYYFYSTSKLIETQKSEMERVYTATNDTNENKEVVKLSNNKINPESLSQKELNSFENIEAQDNAWKDKIKNLLNEKEYVTYLDIKKINEKEKLKAYEDFHDYLRKKYGDNYSYQVSDDNIKTEKRINDKWLNELKKIIGEKKFIQYLKEKDIFNENLRKQNKIFIQVEF